MDNVVVRPAAWSRLIAFAIVTGVGLSQVLLAVADWRLDDYAIYRAAGERLLAAEPLYDANGVSSYRYAPWLAVVTLLVSGPVWSALMLAGSALALVPLARRWREPEALLLLAVFAPILFYLSRSGNVQGPMLAALIWLMPTRWALVGIGVAASLKVTPILFALALVAERRWWQALGAVAVAGVLWVPVVWMGFSDATFDAGAARLLPVPAWAVIAVAATGAAAWTAWRQSALAPLTAALAAIAVLPRFFLYDVTFLLPSASLWDRSPEADRERGQRLVQRDLHVEVRRRTIG